MEEHVCKVHVAPRSQLEPVTDLHESPGWAMVGIHQPQRKGFKAQTFRENKRILTAMYTTRKQSQPSNSSIPPGCLPGPAVSAGKQLPTWAAKYTFRLPCLRHVSLKLSQICRVLELSIFKTDKRQEWQQEPAGPRIKALWKNHPSDLIVVLMPSLRSSHAFTCKPMIMCSWHSWSETGTQKDVGLVRTLLSREYVSSGSNNLLCPFY